MNASPTPRRYVSRGRDPLDPVSDRFRAGDRGDRIVPEEYRVNSQMINTLIKQNRELTAQLERKQEELDRVNVLVASLRGKLVKYTELNKRLTQSGAVSPPEVIQIGKPPAASEPSASDNRIRDIYDKLDALTALVRGSASASTPLHARAHSPGHTHAPAHEEDILTMESAELKGLEDQIDVLKRKLLIKRENELRKLSLRKELLDLMEKLEVPQPAPYPAAVSPPVPTASAPQAPQPAAPAHCDHCQNASRRPAAYKGDHVTSHLSSHPPPAAAQSYMSMAQALETPTPARNTYNPVSDPLW
ncbi:LAMI_0C10550g1_1 [Lachancea mirantina]|uniref:Spindle pole body component SPC42 n=1 Tax=Lachancea mirantina TaxID=1230905 RepID=A0A1G4J5X1_9SACH|nr:LAMI_0C10550g1_1 [Lachancea mirantina]